ncbi:MAG: HPF/RaiA family ribosome-associated protein [Aliidongia sp.]
MPCRLGPRAGTWRRSVIMDRPLEISFHNMDVSEALDSEIRSLADRLETRFDHLIGCRVVVEKLQNRHRNGNAFDVHIVMKVPGQELAVSHEQQKAGVKYSHPDALGAVRDALSAAERRLIDFKQRLRSDTSKPTASAVSGQIALIEPGADHGFILSNTGSQLYFHRDSVTDGRFEDLRQGASVHYVEEAGDVGPTAAKVRIGTKANGQN